jgi:acyl-CoA synthetase (AMP-forming)/AMP-acid ligase II
MAYDALLFGSDSTRPEVPIEPTDVAWLFYTSGTTGKPKGAMETHRNLLTMVQQFLIAILHDACESDVMLHAAPIAHGTASVGLAHLAVGAAQCFPESTGFDPEHIFHIIERLRVSATFLAPTMIQMLLRSPHRHGANVSSLKNVVYGGGPMYVELLKEALAAFGNVFHQIYGQGEAPMTCTTLPKWEHTVVGDARLERRLASAGRELPAVQVRVVDDDDRPVSACEPGEILVRGDLVMRGYWQSPQSSAEALRGGWLHTGDVGFLDEDGYLFITDRKKDLIISGGSNIYPREVEEVLLQHPAVGEVSVIGVPHEKWGETVKAIIVLRDGTHADEQQLIQFCRERIASYKKPTSVEFVDALPKNAYGKVLKRELRERFWGHRGRKV